MTYQFTLILDADASEWESIGDDLFEAGCSDAMLGTAAGEVYLDFDRESDGTLEDAVLEATEQVKAADFDVVRVILGTAR